MTVPGVAWVTLIVMLLPVLANFIATQWPEANGYAWSGAIVIGLGVFGKWLQMFFLTKPPPPPPPATPQARSIGDTGASTPRPPQPSAVRRFLLD